MNTGTIGRVFGYLLLALLVLIMGVVAWAYYLTWDLKRWDAKIDALCTANGGKDVQTRIYETAVAPLTKEYFSKLNPPTSFFIPERSKGKDLGPKYPYVIETRVVEVLNRNDPSVVKFSQRIIRASDNKTLAERFGYQRVGGGIPGVEPDEIRVCPTITTEKRLDVQVFENHPRHASRNKQ